MRQEQIRNYRLDCTLLELCQNGALAMAFRVEDHIDELRKLLHKYRDTPMSLADACVVRIAEMRDRHAARAAGGHLP